ncbi:MAG: AAA family ATPase [Bacteroidales bacterium]|nr:AAA family ATPase [Bacteroidales bacterium]
MDKYLNRIIDKELIKWKNSENHKPLLLRGARQVGKSSAIRNLGKKFKYFLEINFELDEKIGQIFENDLDTSRIISKLSTYYKIPIKENETLLFFDEIQICPRAIQSLRFFYEKNPKLHVIAAGSLLEFALKDLTTFGVGRIHSIFMYPMTFDEFLLAQNEKGLIDEKQNANPENPLLDIFHNKLVDYFRTYLIIGGMPEAVKVWSQTHNYLKCETILDDIATTYEDDFVKYSKKINTSLLRLTLSSVISQVGKKFVYSQVSSGIRSAQIKECLEMLRLAGLIYPVIHTSGNGLPLGAEANTAYTKYLFFDNGLMLRFLSMDYNNNKEITQQILVSSATDLVNKGSLTEMVAGLEIMRYWTNNRRHDMYFWMRSGDTALAEIDYLIPYKSKVIPIEVKASAQGSMKSLFSFMEKPCHEKIGIRTSLENFSNYYNKDKHVFIIPLYAISNIAKEDYELK